MQRIRSAGNSPVTSLGMKKQFREAEFLTSKDLHSFTNLQKEKEEKICRIIFHSVKLLDKAETQYSCL